MQLIDGKKVSLFIKEKVRDEAERFLDAENRPTLAVIIVGNDPASRVYVNNKKKACEFCNIRSIEYALGEDTKQEELLSLIRKLNEDKSVNGILCQLPLPKGLDEKAVIDAIDPGKDVDCFSEINVGALWLGNCSFKPCTPAGVIELLDYYDIDLEGKNCVIVGRSNIVGKPMAALLLERNATVSICHSKTRDIASMTRNADVVILAVGRAGFLTGDMVKDGAIVVDVGINRGSDGKLCGDADFGSVSEKCSFITPVPGGCGPMTIAVLMQNTMTAFKRQNSFSEE